MLEDKKEIRRQELFKVVRFFGSVQAYSNELEIERSRVSNWKNQDHDIPYQYAVVTEEIAEVNLDYLSPFTERANEIIKRLRNKNTLLPIELSIEGILIEESRYSPFRKNNPIIVDTRGVLIAGSEQLKVYKAAGAREILAIVLDI